MKKPKGGMRPKVMKIITLAQQKGGVGKTTVCINLACQAVAHGQSAVILDMDTEQSSAVRWRARRDKREGLAQPEVFSVKSQDLDARLLELKGRGVEWVFIDLPGRTSYGTAMNVSSLTLVPCRPLEDDIAPSLHTVGLIRRGGGKYAYLMNISPPQIDKGRARKVADVLRNAGHTVAPVIVVQRIAVPDANANGLGVNEREPGSQSAKEYSELFEWIGRQFE